MYLHRPILPPLSFSLLSVFCHVLRLGSVPSSLWASVHVTPLLRMPSRACSLRLCPPPPCPSHLLRSISTCLLLDIVRDQPRQTPFSTLPFQLTSSSIWPMESPGRKLRRQGEGGNSGNCLHCPQLTKHLLAVPVLPSWLQHLHVAPSSVFPALTTSSGSWALS